MQVSLPAELHNLDRHVAGCACATSSPPPPSQIHRLFVNRPHPPETDHMSDQFETCFYSLLGVSSRASSKEIQAAYKRLSREFHPDSSREAETEGRYKLISWAFAVIGRDPVVRAEYDRECRARAAQGTLVPSEI